MSRKQAYMFNTEKERVAALKADKQFDFFPEIGFSNGQGVVFNVLSRSAAELCVGSHSLRLIVEMEEDEDGNTGIHVYFNKIKVWNTKDKQEIDITGVEKEAISVALDKAIVATGNYFSRDSN